MLRIEDQVYQDTREEQQKKEQIVSKIEKVGQEIEELERLLEIKRNEREALLSEKQVCEHEIDKERSKFRD